MPPTEPIAEITAEQAAFDLERYRVIDVREPDELEGPLGVIASAENIPLASIEEAVDRLRGPRPLLLVCRSGRRSLIACEKLRALGLQDVTNLAGGMIDWRSEQDADRNADAPAGPEDGS